MAGRYDRERLVRVLTGAALAILVVGVVQAARLAEPAATWALVAPTPVATDTPPARDNPIPLAPPTTARSMTTSSPPHPTRAAVPTPVTDGEVPSSSVPPPVPTTAAAVPLTRPPIQATSPDGYGCAAALAYLAANQAPGFADVCAPHAAGPGDAGKTVAYVGTPTTGTIYISCPAPIVYQNEASNSWKFSGVTSLPLDPWGGVPWSQCRPGDIQPG